MSSSAWAITVLAIVMAFGAGQEHGLSADLRWLSVCVLVVAIAIAQKD